MDYSDDKLPERDHTVGLIRKAMLPLLKDNVSGEDLTALSTALYAEMEKLGQRLEKQITDNRAADVDMSPIAQLMATVLELQKRSIENNITLDAPQLETLSKSVASAVDYIKEQSDAQTELLKAYSNSVNREPIVLPEMRIANIDEIKIPPATAIFNSKYPFMLNGVNVAAPLINTTAGVAMPVVNPDGTFIGGGTAYIIDNETPTGAQDGTNKNFTTYYSYKPGTTKLYLNGVRQREGIGYDYIEAGGNLITTNISPLSIDIMIVDYAKL